MADRVAEIEFISDGSELNLKKKNSKLFERNLYAVIPSFTIDNNSMNKFAN